MADIIPTEFLPPYQLQDGYSYSPSFSRFLQNNDPLPADLDATHAMDMIERATNDIILAQKEIQSLWVQIKKKRTDIWALSRIINDCNTVLSPIRKIPVDIILEIFQAVVQERYDVFETSKGPWLLAHVCKSWRTLACTYSALWSSVDITNVTSRGKRLSLRDPAMLLHTALKRSGTHTLSVWFNYKSESSSRRTAYGVSAIDLPSASIDSNSEELSASDDDDNVFFSNKRGHKVIGRGFVKLPVECQLVTVLVRHSRRLKYLNINVSTPPALKCLRALNGRLDRLETLHITSSCERIRDELEESFSVAPMLHSVYLIDLPLASAAHLPLRQLRLLDHQLQSMQADVWRITVETILLQGSRLTEYAPPSPPAAYNSGALRIHNALIHTFRVRDWYVLDYFRLPGIDELHIRHFGWVKGQSAGDTLSAFIHRSMCALKKLRLRGVPDSILSALPSVHKSLVDLEITVTSSNTQLLPGLATFMCEPGHFPHLSRLEIKVSDEICLFHESLLEYLKQIDTLVGELWNAKTKVRLEIWFSISDFRHIHRICYVKEFRRLRDEGLDIALFVARKSKNWREIVGHGEEEDIEDLRDVLLDEDGEDDDSDSDDFEDDDDSGLESEEC